MRRATWAVLALVFVAGALASATSAALARDADGRSLEIIDGEGQITVQLSRGVLLGQLDNGRVVVTLRRAGQTQVQVSGAQSSFQPDGRTTVYRGRDLRVLVQGASARVVLFGLGIDASIVGRATVGVRAEGQMMIDSQEPPVPLPNDRRPIVLG
jgi:hypothetical protein